MKKLITGLAAVLAFGFYGSVNSAKSIEIEVAYPYSGYVSSYYARVWKSTSRYSS